jgi:hypothetical protein
LHCTPNDKYKPFKEYEYQSSDVTHSVLRSFHGINSCNFPGDLSLLSENDCKSVPNITYTYISRTNFHPEFLNKIVTQEKYQIAMKNETFKNKNEEDNFQLILTAKSSSPEESTNQNIDNSNERNISITNKKEEEVEMSLPIQKKGYMFNEENLISSEALNLLFHIVSGFHQVAVVLQVQ